MALDKITTNNYSKNIKTPAPIFADIYNEAVDQINTNTAAISAIGTSYLGADPTPVVRTNNPIVGTNKVNANIDALDAAIGPDVVSVGARNTGTVGPTVDVNTNITRLDASLGYSAQMSGTGIVCSKANTIIANIEQLDAYKSVQTIKKTIGGVGVAGCDFNFTTAEDQAEQVINLGAIVPAKARILDVFMFTDSAFTGAVSLSTDIGITSGGDGLVTAVDMIPANTVAQTATAFPVAIVGTAQNIYVNSTPGANWSLVTAGKLSVYVTFINVTNI